MRKNAKRAAAGLAAALIATLTATVPASPAAADEPVEIPYTGLVFYSSNPVTAVGSLAAPDGICRRVPAEATWAFPHSGGFHSVPGYQTPDCSGPGWNLNSFHSWDKGLFLTYRALL
ncbi:hypothetical protein ABZ403_20300 [Micromonospora zamorensis]|uniref:hypothetical protein n=1 Tax=Micromonospora zamorensis TaxID=709883 RepID=UPI0033C8B7E6